MQLQIEAVQGLEAFRCLDVLGLTQHANIHGHLEVVLLLAHESIITHRKVEALVSVHPIGEHRPESGKGGRLIIRLRLNMEYSLLLQAHAPTPLFILHPPKIPQTTNRVSLHSRHGR